jgi:hypothetical protein
MRVFARECVRVCSCARFLNLRLCVFFVCACAHLCTSVRVRLAQLFTRACLRVYACACVSKCMSAFAFYVRVRARVFVSASVPVCALRACEPLCTFVFALVHLSVWVRA